MTSIISTISAYVSYLSPSVHLELQYHPTLEIFSEADYLCSLAQLCKTLSLTGIPSERSPLIVVAHHINR